MSARDDLNRHFDLSKGWCYPCVRRWVTPRSWAAHLIAMHPADPTAQALLRAGLR